MLRSGVLHKEPGSGYLHPEPGSMTPRQLRRRPIFLLKHCWHSGSRLAFINKVFWHTALLVMCCLQLYSRQGSFLSGPSWSYHLPWYRGCAGAEHTKSTDDELHVTLRQPHRGWTSAHSTHRHHFFPFHSPLNRDDCPSDHDKGHNLSSLLLPPFTTRRTEPREQKRV